MNRGPIAETDRILVKRYLVTQMVLTAFDRDKGNIQHSGLFKTPNLYTDLIDKAIDEAIKEITSVKKAFRNRGIKVYEEHRTKLGVDAKFMCRGYHDNMQLRWAFITAEATVLMRLFLGLDIGHYLNPAIPGEKEPTLFSRSDT
ncbi:hypothetical protein [Paenibacillus cineris]|uniref:hypothetical protein n=1 Tax=Paenibacillus cineris TaxID=237530 RepID=UPI001B1533CA|nr:hypothetical protein [Paenibacillus cineris]GIO63596.1 hypothetical protein J43TS9_51700 [Paenibacillus cineris]